MIYLPLKDNKLSEVRIFLICIDFCKFWKNLVNFIRRKKMNKIIVVPEGLDQIPIPVPDYKIKKRGHQ